MENNISALNKVNVRTVINLIESECKKAISEDLLQNSSFYAALRSFKERKFIYDYRVDDPICWRYHSSKLIHKSRRLWLSYDIIDHDDNIIPQAGMVKVHSKRHYMRLWKKLSSSGEHMDVNIWLKPIQPVSYIQMKYTIKKD